MKTIRILAAVLLLMTAVSAFGVNRAFVSGTGVDTGVCPITAPCRSFAYALTQIISGGEIIALDTAGYGAATITQSALIIAAPGVTAFSTGTSGSVITVAAGASDSVTLRGITVTANGATVGVAFNAGKTLNIENCIVNGFATGIAFDRTNETGSPKLHVTNTVVRNNTTGIDANNSPLLAIVRSSAVAPPPDNLLFVTLANSYFLDNAIGVSAGDTSRVTASDCVLTGNSTYGIYAHGDDGLASLVALEHCTISDNSVGVQSGDNTGSQVIHGVVRLANNTITNNIDGVVTTITGSTLSRVSNAVSTNTIEGNYLDVNGALGSYLAK